MDMLRNELLPERRELSLSFHIALGQTRQYADAPHRLGLLRTHRKRPTGSRA